MTHIHDHAPLPPLAEGQDLLRLEEVRFSYPGGPPVLDGLSFTLAPGDRVAILGPNGAGKSTLFQVAMGLLRPEEGAVVGLGRPCLEEADFFPLRAALGYLFQDSDDQLFCPTVLEDVAFGPMNLLRDHHAARHAALETLESLGLSGYERRVTYRLSGGEKRLVALAAVLAMRPRGLLLDEPTAGLDEAHAERLTDILMHSDLAWAVISHDREFLNRTCTRFLALNGGKLHQKDGS